VFRHFLRPARTQDGAVLRAQLAEMGRRLQALATSDLMLEETSVIQGRLVPAEPGYALPERPPVTIYARGSGAAPAFTGTVAIAMGWALEQPRFALEDLIAQFDFVSEAELRAAVAAAEATGAVVRV
jgi:bifunctional lysine-specific demethylase and histidyl-hydroxylase NO66